MSGLAFIPWTGTASFRRSVGSPRQFGPAVDAEVTRLWDSKAAQGLTDGLILSVVATGDIVELSPVHYRYWWAQKVRPDLFVEPLDSLAVSGLSWCENRLLLGRRAAWVTQDANCLELVPSGSVDAGDDDLFAQFDREMTEELGIDRGVITAHRVIGMVDDRANNVIDVVVETRLTCTFADVLQAHAGIERAEYSELHALTPAELRQAIDRDPISAVSRTIFAHAVQEA